MAVTFAMDAFSQKTKTLVKDLYQLKLVHFLFFLWKPEFQLKMRQANVHMGPITKCKKQRPTEMFFNSICCCYINGLCGKNI